MCPISFLPIRSRAAYTRICPRVIERGSNPQHGAWLQYGTERNIPTCVGDKFHHAAKHGFANRSTLPRSYAEESNPEFSRTKGVFYR